MVGVDLCEIVKQNTPEAFDVFWGSVYARTHYMTPNRLRHARHIASLVPAGASVLDTGCGDGTLLGIIGRGVGVDYSFVSAIRTNGPSAVGDATRLPVHDNCFGCVTCIEVLEHVYNPGLIAAEVTRVLAPGGIAIVGVPDGSKDTWDGHIGRFSVADIVALFPDLALHGEYPLRNDFVLTFKK